MIGMISPSQVGVGIDANTKSALEHLKAHNPGGFNVSKWFRVSVQQTAMGSGWMPLFNKDGSQYCGDGQIPEITTTDDDVDFEI